jgi:hypothetical protein
MPITSRFDEALGCTIAVWQGDVTIRDTDRQLMHLSSDANWPPETHLIDGTAIETLILPDPELVELLFEGTNVLRAAVVRPDLLDDALREYTAGVEFTTFTDRAAACAYLGLDSAAVEAVIEDLRQEIALSPSC